MYPKIIGLDESGKVGDPYIIFSLVEFLEDSEADIFIQNIINSGDLFLDKKITNGWDKSKKIKTFRSLMHNRLIDVKFYKLNLRELIKSFKDIFKFQAKTLFELRKILIERIDDKNNKDFISDLISQLYHYRKYYYLPEFFIKSYSYLFITNRLCHDKNFCEYLDSEKNIIKIQIDGGNVFSFWWFKLLTTINQADLFENKLFINGVSHGDQYYLSMNLANLFANTLKENYNNFFDYRIEDIKYDFKEFNFNCQVFFESIWNLLKNFQFKNRLLLIGNTKLFNILPFLFNLKKRSKIFEPFKINDDIKDFFQYFKIGEKRKNLVVYSDNLHEQEKENIKYCKDIGIEVKSVNDFERDFFDFCDYLNKSIDLYSTKVQTKVENTLKIYEKLF